MHVLRQKMTEDSPSSWFTIIAIVAVQLVVAATLAYAVAQGYLAWSCSDSEFFAENLETCTDGFPYPIY
jgi:hypothetical protein